MVQSPSWEANRFATFHGTRRLITALTRVRQLALSWASLIQSSHLLKIHPNIINTSMPTSPEWSPSVRFPDQDSIQVIQYLLTYLISYLLTYSMVQSPSWEANCFAESQEIPLISRNTKVHYRTHKCPPPVSILGQPNPVHIPTYHLLEINPNIIKPSMPRSPKWSPSPRFPHQDPIQVIQYLLTYLLNFFLTYLLTHSMVQSVEDWNIFLFFLWMSNPWFCFFCS